MNMWKHVCVFCISELFLLYRVLWIVALVELHSLGGFIHHACSRRSQLSWTFWSGSQIHGFDCFHAFRSRAKQSSIRRGSKLGNATHSVHIHIQPVLHLCLSMFDQSWTNTWTFHPRKNVKQYSKKYDHLDDQAALTASHNRDLMKTLQT